MFILLTQIFSGGVSFSPEAMRGRRRRRSNAIFLSEQFQKKSFFFTADELNFLGSRRLLLFPRAQWSPYYYN